MGNWWAAAYNTAAHTLECLRGCKYTHLHFTIQISEAAIDQQQSCMWENVCIRDHGATQLYFVHIWTFSMVDINLHWIRKTVYVEI